MFPYVLRMLRMICLPRGLLASPGTGVVTESGGNYNSLVLGYAEIEYVHSSDFIRTRGTAAPTAAEHGLEVKLYDPRELPALVVTSISIAEKAEEFGTTIEELEAGPGRWAAAPEEYAPCRKRTAVSSGNRHSKKGGNHETEI